MMVNKFNRQRNEDGFAVVMFNCSMYSLGQWSVELRLSFKGCFFHEEMKELSKFCASGWLILFVGARDNSPVLYIQ